MITYSFKKHLYFLNMNSSAITTLSDGAKNNNTMQNGSKRNGLLPDGTKSNFIKSPMFIGICIVIGLIIMVVLYVVFTQQKNGLFNTSSKNNSKNSSKNSSKNKLDNMPKLNIKLATNDSEINNLINNINSGL